MGFRTVVIKNRTKLDLRLNYMISRGETEVKVFIPEISCLIIESTAVALTSALLSELIKNNVKVIFCDEKHNPESELVSYHNNYISAKRIMMQINWDKIFCEKLWTKIVQEKILKQSQLLFENDCVQESKMLESYASQVEINDLTNREGFSAKVYFNALFGKGFERRSESKINSALNYGYSIVLSCFNREITERGFLTQIGLWHKNDFNHFNLSCDLMEPFRILIDKIVCEMSDEEFEHFKVVILEIFNKSIYINSKSYIFEDAIKVYCQGIFNALENKNLEEVKFYEL